METRIGKNKKWVLRNTMLTFLMNNTKIFMLILEPNIEMT